MKLTFLAQCNTPSKCKDVFHKAVHSFEESTEITPDKNVIITHQIYEKAIKQFQNGGECCNVTLEILAVETNEGKRIYPINKESPTL